MEILFNSFLRTRIEFWCWNNPTVRHYDNYFYKNYNFIVKNPIIVSSETSIEYLPLPEFNSGSDILVYVNNELHELL